MIFETHTLTSPLSDYVESVFHFKGFTPDHSIERVVPTGHVFMIFELDGMERHTYDNQTLEPNATYTHAWISGAHRNYLSISAHQDSEMFVIQFKPFGAYPFLHTPIDSLCERVLPADQVVGAEVLALRDKILGAATSQEKFTHAEEWLKSRYKEDLVPPSELLTVYENLGCHGAENQQEILRDYPNTQKHLIDQFKKYMGLTPKYSQRIIRFNEILQKIQKEQKVSWAQIAYECGFTDQSYFIKEFKHFSGFNPQEFIKQDFEQDDNFFPLDRRG